jgi:hypothetical protein
MAGIDPLLFWGGKPKKRNKFAGADVFKVTSEDYSKSVNGRKKWQRWNKNMNMEEIDNQDIRTYCHRNPGKAVIIQDENSGVMSYLIPPSIKRAEESGEHLDEKIVTGKDGVKRLKGAFHWPLEVTRPSRKRKAKPSQLPRQLKNNQTEMMVSHPETGAVSVIDKKDWEEHEKQGYGVAESVEHLDEATKAEKKARQVQNRTASAYARQKTELEPGEKTAKFNRLANQLDKLRKLNDHVELDEWGTSYDQDAQIGDIVKKDRKKADARTRQQWKDMQKEKEKAVPETKRKKEMTNKKHNNDISN